jgi:hypothetical protein
MHSGCNRRKRIWIGAAIDEILVRNGFKRDARVTVMRILEFQSVNVNVNRRLMWPNSTPPEHSPEPIGNLLQREHSDIILNKSQG